VKPEELRSSYDAVADDYAQKFFDELTRKPFDRNRLEGFARRCPPGRVLDIGCGPGHVGRFLSEHNIEVTGIDLSPAMVDSARRLNPDITFEVGDMRHLSFGDGSIAGIVAFYSLIHVGRHEAAAVLGEFRRVLMPGGRLLLAVHGGAGKISSDQFLGHEVRFEATLFEKSELAGMVEAAGFMVDEATERERYDFETHTRRACTWRLRESS
jgi:SAM-dependent methyltransferase